MKIHRDLLKGSFVLLILFGIYNFFNFVFQFSMARMLSVSDYGILAAIFSITYILTVFTESIQTIITKYSSSEKDEKKIKGILLKSLGKAGKLSAIIFILFLVAGVVLSPLLKIPYVLFGIAGLIVFGSILLPVTRGVMQGKKKFSALGINMISESVLKLILAVIFVFVGWRVYGALIGAVLGVSFSFILSLIPLKKILKEKEKKFKSDGIYNYARPAFFIMFVVMVFYSIDVIIAKIVFSNEIAGVYAIASVLGKILFWGSMPISKAMFAITSEDKNEKKNLNVFGNSLVVLIGILGFAILVFYLFPNLIVEIFSGKILPMANSILFYLGVAFSLLSLANLVLLYKLSTAKVDRYPLLGIFVLLEIGLLFYFSGSVIEFSIALITASAALLWGSVFLFTEHK